MTLAIQKTSLEDKYTLDSGPRSNGHRGTLHVYADGCCRWQENPLELIESNKFHEVQKYAIGTRHVYYTSTFIFSDQCFQKLPEELRKILKDEGGRAMLQATERMEAMEHEIKKRLQEKGMEDRNDLLF